MHVDHASVPTLPMAVLVHGQRHPLVLHLGVTRESGKAKAQPLVHDCDMWPMGRAEPYQVISFDTEEACTHLHSLSLTHQHTRAVGADHVARTSPRSVRAPQRTTHVPCLVRSFASRPFVCVLRSFVRRKPTCGPRGDPGSSGSWLEETC